MINPERQIPVSAIVPNPEQPRKQFDQDALLELAESIRQYGLLQPLVVRPHGEAYMIIAGERRWRASQLAGLESVPCRLITDVSDEEAFILSTTENVARRDMTPIEEAKAYERIRTLGRTLEDVARLFGKSPETIQKRIDLLKLREEIQHLVARGLVSLSLGWHLSRISHNGQGETLREFNAGRFQNDEQAIRFIDAVYKQENQADMFGQILDAFDDERQRKHRTATNRAWEQLAGMSKALSTITDTSPIDLAAALQGDCELYKQRLDLLAKHVARAQAIISEAVAHLQSWQEGAPA